MLCFFWFQYSTHKTIENCTVTSNLPKAKFRYVVAKSLIYLYLVLSLSLFGFSMWRDLQFWLMMWSSVHTMYTVHARFSPQCCHRGYLLPNVLHFNFSCVPFFSLCQRSASVTVCNCFSAILKLLSKNASYLRNLFIWLDIPFCRCCCCLFFVTLDSCMMLLFRFARCVLWRFAYALIFCFEMFLNSNSNNKKTAWDTCTPQFTMKRT